MSQNYHDAAWYYDELRDDENAERFYRLNIEHRGEHYRVSIYNLAHLLRFRKREEAITLLNMILEDVDALRLLGNMHLYHDEERALFYFQEAIQMGDTRAMCELASAFTHGTSKVGKNLDRAFLLYQQAADACNVKAWMHVADCYQLGRGTPQSYEKELECLLKVPQGQLDATHLFNLAMIYYRGQVMGKRDKVKALDLFFEGDSKFKDKDAQYMIAQDFEHAGNRDLARVWFKKAADQNDMEAIVKMMDIRLARDEEERKHYFLQYLFLRHNQPWTIKETRVDCKLVDTLYTEVLELRKQVEEYELMPPPSGGILYHEAKELFYLHAQENDMGGHRPPMDPQ